MVTLKNESTGSVKQVKVGFSWTVMFFGIFVPLFRGDWLWFLIMTVAAIVTSGWSWIIFPFIYNRVYVNSLTDKGYRYV